MNLTPTKCLLKRNVLLALATILFFSCQKDLSIDNGIVSNPPDLATKINSSVSGFVTDENDAPVLGATVQFGSASISTDKYGYFEAKNVQVVKDAAIVTVSKPGYFKGIKTYMARAGKAAFFRIKLIPKTTVGNFSASTGGTVSLSNGLTVKLPAASVVNAATNAVYTGTVNVAAHWLNPEAVDLPMTMPGDLRGIDKAGSIKRLQTFGMAAVELTGASGESLQIATGKKATLGLTIPASLVALAPSSIALWYFDEAKGLWKEEGSATRTGNTYSGDVSHFSFWNYDTPASYVQFDCTLKDASGNPVPQTLVQLSVVATNNMAWGYTDASGFVAGPIPDNAQMLLEVFPSSYCSNPVYTQTFTTTNVNISLGVITIPAAVTANITGTVTNCNNGPVTNGDILMALGNGGFYIYPLSNTGTFNFSTLLCSNTVPATLIAQDHTAQQQSALFNTNLVTGTNAIGNLQACNLSNAEFINYSINGTNYSISKPTDTMLVYATFPPDLAIIVNGGQIVGNNSAYIRFASPGIGINSLQSLTYFAAAQMPTVSIPNPINVLITEYGTIGQFVSGNFSGIVTATLPPNTSYTVSCNFRYRRTF